ncbi:MAG: S8 family serine peptidase [Candidatus Omnitrophica bacterium]|nr:S8 family serine peptidase [Candidatus Omnitrophota bacterium]
MESFSVKLGELQEKYTGEGIKIAMLDTGVNAENLGIDIAGGFNFTDISDSENYMDVLGHGTVTASVIKGKDGEGGVAPDAEIMALKILNDDSETTSSIVSDAIYYAVDMGAKVLAMPFSLFPVSAQVEAAIEYAFDKGAVLIAAAGNEGTEISDNSLAAQEQVITVGSLDADGKMSAWSNYGDPLDLLAPWDVVTIDGTEDEAGTSFSAAFVAGVTALMLSEDPAMTPEDVLIKLKSMMTAGIEGEDTGYEEYGKLVMEKGEEKEEEEAKEEKEIKGVDIDEVVSRNEAQALNQEQFTGYSIITDEYKELDQKKRL